MSHDTTAAKDLVVAQLRADIARAESATCQKATNPSQISSESATPGLRTDNPMAEPVMGGLPRHEGERLGSFATVCYKCGAQIMDPFTGAKQIHDVEHCTHKLLARHRAKQQSAS